MTILKWYSIVIVVMSLLHSLYKAGQRNENLLIITIAVLLEMPIIVYLMIS